MISGLLGGFPRRDTMHEYRCVVCGAIENNDYVPECHDRTMNRLDLYPTLGSVK